MISFDDMKEKLQENTIDQDDDSVEHPRKRYRERKTQKFQPEFILFLVATLIITTIVAILLSPICAIKNVEIDGEQFLSEEKILAEAGSPLGQNLFFYRTGEGASNLKLNPYVKEAKISRRPFTGLLITIEERKPVGVIVDNGVFLQFSEDGMLMTTSDSLQTTNLPIITGLSLLSVPAPGEFITEAAFYEALQIVNACPDALLPHLQEINITHSNNILAYTAQGIEVRLGDTEHIESRMQALSDMTEQVILGGSLNEPVEYIDLRYPGAASIKIRGKGAVASQEIQKKDEAKADGAKPQENAAMSTLQNGQ